MNIRVSAVYAEQLLKEGRKVYIRKDDGDLYSVHTMPSDTSNLVFEVEAKVDVGKIVYYLQLEEQKAEIENKLNQIKSDFQDDAIAYNSFGGYDAYSLAAGDAIMTCKRSATPTVLLGNAMLESFGAAGNDLLTVKPEEYSIATKAKVALCAAVTGEYGEQSADDYLKGLCAYDDEKYAQLKKKLRVKPEVNREVFKSFLGLDSEAAENAANTLELCRRRDTLSMMAAASPFKELDLFIDEIKKYIQVSVKDSVTVTR